MGEMKPTWYTHKTYPYKLSFHQEFLGRTRKIYWYLGGTRTQRNIDEEGVEWGLWVEPREPTPIQKIRDEEHAYFFIHRCQYHDTGRYFKPSTERSSGFGFLECESWECSLLPNHDMAFNHIRRFSRENPHVINGCLRNGINVRDTCDLFISNVYPIRG
jgi:hypothetical protein